LRLFASIVAKAPCPLRVDDAVPVCSVAGHVGPGRLR